MRLRRPHDQLAGCCWLPRFADKARLYLSGRLPSLYRLAFGSRFGMDGYFLRHFGLSAREFLAGVSRSEDDAALARWFTSLRGATPQRIADWNVRAPMLGARGHPGFVARHAVKWLLYPKSVGRPVGSMFEAIDQDEGTGPFAGPRG